MPDSVPNSGQGAALRRATRWRAYLADEGGNFLPLFALFIPVLLLALGSATDYISATRREDTINGIADAAALAATTPAMMTNSCVVVTSATCATVITQMTDVFNAQLAQVQGIGAVTPTITIVDSAATPTQRTATVAWTSTSNNAFGGILGINTLAIAGQSQAKNSVAPVTTFYMLIDESPSMAFPAQAAGVTTMFASAVANGLGACAFGCHQSDATAYKDNNLWNPSNVTCAAGANALSGGVFTDGDVYFGCVDSASGFVLPVGKTTVKVGATTYTCASDGTGVKQTVGTYSGNTYYGAEDNFALSRCLDVQLRVDLVNQAVTSLMTTAPTTAIENNTTYAVQLYTLDLGSNNLPNTYSLATGVTTPGTFPVTNPATKENGMQTVFQWPSNGSPETPAQIDTQTQAEMNTGFAAATTAAAAIDPLETISEGDDSYSWIDASGTSGSGIGSAAVTGGLEGMYNLMPAPGNGGTSAGDTPQEVLFIVTDGMNDVDSSANTASCIGTATLYEYYGRPVFCAGQTKNPKTGNPYCTDIKAKGIRIAFLYLRYNWLNSYGDYVSDFEPWQYPSGETGDDEIEQSAIACASPNLEFTVNTGDDIATAMNALFQKAVQTAYLSH